MTQLRCLVCQTTLSASDSACPGCGLVLKDSGSSTGLRYVIKREPFSETPFEIRDEQENIAFTVSGSAYSNFVKMKLFSADGSERLVIVPSICWVSKFEFFRNEKLIATMEFNTGILSPQYLVKFEADSEPWLVDGNYGAFDFRISQGSSELARVHRRDPLLIATYDVELNPGCDTELVLAVAAMVHVSAHRNRYQPVY